MSPESVERFIGRTGVSLVIVRLEGIAAFGKGENVLWDDLVHGEGAATEDLAGVAVAVGQVSRRFKIGLPVR